MPISTLDNSCTNVPAFIKACEFATLHKSPLSTTDVPTLQLSSKLANLQHFMNLQCFTNHHSPLLLFIPEFATPLDTSSSTNLAAFIKPHEFAKLHESPLSTIYNALIFIPEFATPQISTMHYSDFIQVPMATT